MTQPTPHAKLEAFIHKPRTKLPWLKGRKGLLDCAAAVSWVFGFKPELISCGRMIEYLKAHGWQWFTTGVPKPDDIVFFDWHTAKGMGKGNINHDHVGIVIKATKTQVTYVSADATRPTPGLVTDNAVGYKWVLGYARKTKS